MILLEISPDFPVPISLPRHGAWGENYGFGECSKSFVSSRSPARLSWRSGSAQNVLSSHKCDWKFTSNHYLISRSRKTALRCLEHERHLMHYSTFVTSSNKINFSFARLHKLKMTRCVSCLEMVLQALESFSNFPTLENLFSKRRCSIVYDNPLC